MNVAKLGKKGQVSIPKAILERLGLKGEELLLIEATDDGAIMLHPAGVYPIELYSSERIQEFLKENEITPEEEARVKAKLASLRH
jgi:AbrB family looped-hinge helix DNA binding protein